MCYYLYMSETSALNLQTADIKTFIPSRDYGQSLRFYEAMGWKVEYKDDSLALLELDDSRFYIQNYYVKDWAHNFMLHISVEDAAAWHQHASAVIAGGDFGPAKVREPKKEDYGPIVTYVWDPSGVLLHFAQWKHDQA